METTKFVRKPFIVKAVEITADNIEEISKQVGTLCVAADGAKFIQVNPRMVPGIDRVYVGYWMTKMNKNVRCYSKKIFTEQFIEANDQIEDWINFLNGVEPVLVEE